MLARIHQRFFSRPYKLVKHDDLALLVETVDVDFPLSDQVEDTIDECINTLRHIDGFWYNKGLALSAPQVGSNHRLFVMVKPNLWHNDRLKFRNINSYINPKILEFSKEQVLAWEGCLSNDQYLALISRPQNIKVKFCNFEGETYETQLSGSVARLFQHEVDHLDGKQTDVSAIRFQSIPEIDSPEAAKKFYEENREYMLV